MSTDHQYNIRPYTPADNGGLAVMWNGSDDRWPGTFTGGVPMTEARVAEWMDREVSLVRLVVQSEMDGCIAGYGSLWADTTRPDTCYVDLLNVHPDHQGRSLARRILTQMVDYATEHGYDRMTIGTWSANLYAMPLYKKVGYFWIPETQVFMESYLPAIRRLAAAKPFFEKHDWYRTYARALDQVEDDERHPATGDMKVYVCRWEEDGDSLEVLIDRHAQAITGMATADFAAYAAVSESEPAQGIAYPVRWTIANRRAQPVNVTVLARGDDGIDLDYHGSLSLAPGEERVIEAAYVCPADAPPLDPDRFKPAPKVRTTLVIGDQVIELASGLRYRPAVEFTTEPAYPSLLPGQPQIVQLRLHNRAKRTIEGTVSITPQDGLEMDWLRRDFSVDADGYLGLPIRVTSARSGPLPLLAAATFTVDGTEIAVPPQPLLLLSTPLGEVTAGSTADFGAAGGKEVAIAENDFFQAVGRPSGGRCLVFNKALRRREARIIHEAGPPFEPWDLANKNHQLSVRHEDGRATLCFTAQSTNFPGVTVTREVTISSSPLIEVRHRVVNNGAQPYSFWIRPGVQISDRERAHTALPHGDRLIMEHGSDFPATHGDVPKKPDGLAEQWYALSDDGQVAGAIWSADIVEHELFWGTLHLHYAQQEVAPQTSRGYGPYYLYVGPGDWRDVQRAWKRLVGVRELGRESQVEPARAHVFGISPRSLVTLGNQIDAHIRVDSTRDRPLNGRIVVEPPPGWTVDRQEVPVEEIRTGHPLEAAIRLEGGGRRPGATAGRLLLSGEISDERRSFTVVKLGDSTTAVHVSERREADQPLWEIDNGRSVWTVAPNYHGGLIEWRDRDRAVNHLLSPFPERGELGWMSPLFGGVRPSVMDDPNGEDFPGKLHDESFTASSAEVVDALGIRWHGVQLASTLTKAKLTGFRVELAYLTVGDSNVLKVLFRLINESDAYRRIEPHLLAFLQVDGRYDNAVLYGDALQRKRSTEMIWPRVGAWGVVENPESGRAVALVAGSGERDVSLMDWGVDGGHLIMGEHTLLAPKSGHDIVAYLAMADSMEEAKLYRALARGG